DYAQALDSLMNAGFWMDAAYVAERVLTVDELKSYVDRFWPPATPEQIAAEREHFAVGWTETQLSEMTEAEEEHFTVSEVCPAVLREQIRYLLARRLTREMRGDEAREYYPNEWVSAFDQLAANLRAGWDEAQEPRERAEALFRAALITRTNGMELAG